MTTQSGFTDALLDADAPAPEGVKNPFGGAAGKRFDVYRNNVVSSLIDALATGFPVLQRLVGEEFFRAMAGVFVRAHPPDDPRLMFYGRRLPGFLADFPPVAHLPYLPDVAKLELGLRESYHAADAPPLTLTGYDPAEVLALCPRMAPSALVVRSNYPIYDIWRANTDPDAPKPGRAAQTVLITRPLFDPAPHLLPEGGFDFARRLKGRLPLSDAMAATLAAAPGADVAALMSLFVSTGALTLETETP
ncbi:MAG: DNA-binding domain-containing protein [Pseudomonadota bacterium]